jgi:SAM-dependent methyltransferase
MSVFIDDFEAVFGDIPGQLHPATANLAMYLLNAQTEASITGNLLEIGVYGGRFLGLMQRYLAEGEQAIGIDPFYIEGSGPEQVRSDLERRNAIEGVTILKSRSDSLSIDDYRQKWGPIRFFHIDGSHQCDDVLKDLIVCDTVLSPDGLLAFDDFLNPYWMGVTEALFRHKLSFEGGDLVPIVFFGGKLFLCREAKLDWYSTMFTTFLSDHPDRLPRIASVDRTTKLFGRVIPVIF